MINIVNRSATYEFAIEQKFVAGMVLTGTEIKSIRAGKVSFNDSFCLIHQGELFLKSLHIAEYAFGTSANHDPVRERKLLLNRKEIKKMQTAIKEKGFTIIPLRIFLNEKGLAKLEIALARGKKLHDKRESIKNRDAERELRRSFG